ncbi:MAG: hypothetical protein U0L98_01845 [Clostridia bacterium]|nr:hypothetical protein [Clostridia bacterium]
MDIKEAKEQLLKHKKEIDTKYINARYSKAIEVVLSELDKKDKIIYNLAFALADYVMYYEYDKCRNPEMIKNKAKEQIEYFTNKVEEGKGN